MTTVAEMIEWLKTQPQDALVEVLSHTPGTGHYDQGGWCSVMQFDPTLKPSWCHENTQCYLHWELYSVKGGVSTLLLGEMP